MARNHAAMRIATNQAQLLGTIVLDRGDAYDLELPFVSFSASIQTAFTPAELRAFEQQRVHGIGVLVHDNLDREYRMSFVYRNELWRLQGGWGTLTGSNNYRRGTLVHLWWYRCPVPGYDSLSTLHLVVESHCTFATPMEARRAFCPSCRQRFPHSR